MKASEYNVREGLHDLCLHINNICRSSSQVLFYYKETTGLLQVFLKTRLGPFQHSCPGKAQKELPNSNTLLFVSVFVPTSIQLKTSNSKLGREGVGSDKVFGKCELTLVGWLFGGGA